MWMIQIIIGAFWFYASTALLFREHLVWESVENINWFKNRYHNSTSRSWEQFCRDTGLISLAIACLLFITLPFGMGIVGVIIFVSTLLLMR